MAPSAASNPYRQGLAIDMDFPPPMTTNPPPNDAFRDFERDVHDRLAESYHQAFTPVTRHAIDPLLDTLAPLQGRRLLDVATGSGPVAAAAAGRGATTIGVDLSPRMVELASRLHPGINFKAADAQRLPFDDAAFDAVVCAFGVGHFPNAEDALTEWRRVLAPGGKVAVSWWDDASRSRINGIFFDAVTALGLSLPPTVPSGPSAFRYSSEDALTALLGGAGFGNVVVNRVARFHDLPDLDALWHLARSSFARISTLIEALGDADRALLKTDVESRVIPYRRGARFEIPVSFLVAHGTAP